MARDLPSPRRRIAQPGTSLVVGPAMDTEILRDLFAHTVRRQRFSASIALCATSLRPRGRAWRQPDGKAGQLQEWLRTGTWSADIHHRHASHPYALFRAIRSLRAVLAAAARKSLRDPRAEATGWGLGWRLNLPPAGRRPRPASRASAQAGSNLPNMFVRTRRSRSTAISGARPASPRCCSRPRWRNALPPALPPHGPAAACAPARRAPRWTRPGDGKLSGGELRATAGDVATRLRYGTATQRSRSARGGHTLSASGTFPRANR